MAEWINDLKLSAPVIAGSIGWAFLFGVLYMLFVRFFADIVVWGSIVVYFCLLITLMVLCFTRANTLQKRRDGMNSEQGTENISVGETSENSIYALQIIGYSLIAIIVLSVILIICNYNKIKLAIAIIKTATLYVIDVKEVMFVPVIFTIVISCFLVFWLFGLFYLYSMGEI